MLKFQISTQYALQMLGIMYEKKGALIRAADMAETIGTSYLYAIKILGILKDKGIVKSEQGCNGGYRMAQAPEKITIYDVVCAIDGEIVICSELSGEGDKRVGQYFVDLKGLITSNLKRESILSLFEKKIPAKENLVLKTAEM